MSDSEENVNETHEDVNSEVESDSATQNINEILNNSVENAIALFRKVRENGKDDLTEKQIAQIDKECDIIRDREIITKDLPHERIEITSKDDQTLIGPPTLTRFEKARIMGARALQLSLGAPVLLKFQKMQQHRLKLQWKN